MKIDYSRKINWLSLPDERCHEVDTFYLYPSSYLSNGDENRPFADIQDRNMKKIAGICFEIQGGAFASSTDVYAPLYRQVDPFVGFKMMSDNRAYLIDKIILGDVIEAFDYYYRNFNNGKPFILAGHSQGSTMLMKMLESYFRENMDIYRNMVAAYLIGFGVDREYLKKNPHLKFAKGETDTGVLVSWNTQKPNLEEKSPIVSGDALVINPLNWKRDETYASVELNKGSLVKGKLVIPGIADAKINIKKGVLECGTVNPEDFKQMFDFFPEGCYHSMDYGFYYENIKENVRKRAEAFLRKK